MTAVGSASAGADPSTTWLPFSRVALEWLNPVDGLDVEAWVPGVVDRAQAAGIDTLAFDFWHGGYAVFNGSIAPKDRHVGDTDVLALLDRELHERGMRLVLMNMGGHCNSYAAAEHSSWQARDSEGRPRPGVQTSFMCLNSPYSSYLIQELRRVLPRCTVDGLYIEGLYGLPCYCHYCRAEFFELYRYHLPEDERLATASSDCREFRSRTATKFIRRCREVIDELSPSTVFIPCPSWFEENYADYAAWRPYADVVALERQWGAGRFTCALWEIGLSMQVVRAISGRPTLGTLFLAWGVDRDYAPCPAPHFRLNFMEILLHGATPQLHLQTMLEQDQTELDTVREMFDFEAKLQPFLRGAEPLAFAALVLDYDDYRISENFKGFYQTLTERHIPFSVLDKADLGRTDLSPYRVLVLPDVKRMSDEAIEAIHTYTDAGGGCVFTYQSGWFDEDGARRSTAPLNALAGATEPYGVVSNPADGVGLERGFLADEEFQILPQTYFRLDEDSDTARADRGRLMSFKGNHVIIGTTTGTAGAHALDYDFAKMHRHHPVVGWYPGSPSSPLVVRSTEGDRRGRCVYVAAEFDQAAYTQGKPGVIDLLADAVLWASDREPPLTTSAGITVELATHVQQAGNGFVCILVNQSFNQQHPAYVVREVMPVRPLSISLELPDRARVDTVASTKGGSVTWEVEGSRLALALDQLDEYDAIVVNLAAVDGGRVD